MQMFCICMTTTDMGTFHGAFRVAVDFLRVPPNLRIGPSALCCVECTCFCNVSDLYVPIYS